MTVALAHEHKAQIRAKEVQAEAKPMRDKPGRPRKDDEEKHSYNPKVSYGENPEYIASRLKRDSLELAEKVVRPLDLALVRCRHCAPPNLDSFTGPR